MPSRPARCASFRAPRGVAPATGPIPARDIGAFRGDASSNRSRTHAACPSRTSASAPSCSSCSKANSRTVSSIQNRGVPSGLESCRSRLFETSDERISAPFVSGLVSDGMATRSAPSRGHPSAKTARRRKVPRASGSSRSRLHAMVARRVRWRDGASRGPAVSNETRRSSRASRSRGAGR